MKVSSRKEAKNLGLSTYYTGKPCKYGHVAERATGTGSCKVCKSLRNRHYRDANKQKIKAYLADYYASNIDRERRRRAEHYSENSSAIRARVAKYAKANKEKIAQSCAVYYAENREKLLLKAKEHRKNNLEGRRVYFRKRQQEQRGKVNASVKRIKLAKKKRTPIWLTNDDLWLMNEVYDLAALRTECTGVKWHVDHIVPLHGKTVSGLHVPSNLQVITQEENLRKLNSWNPDNG